MKRVLMTALFASVLVSMPATAQSYQRMDQNGDGAITRSEWRGSTREFRNRDWNRDGVLTGDEITGQRSDSYNGQNGYSRDTNSGTYSEQSRARSNSGERAASRLDKNNSGVIEGYEWPYNANVFHQLDTNKDSVLEPNELRNISQATMQQLDKNHNGRIDDDEWPGGFAQFENLDQNNDGRVSSDEYLNRGGEWQRRRRFDTWDANQDSRLSMSEWKSSAQLFRNLDRNHDGYVDWTEYQANTDRYDAPFAWR